jgi:hypothetical protein
MPKKEIATGVVHKVPQDLKKALVLDTVVLKKWNDLTPLARNEWICWIISVKTKETRKNHVERTINELKKGIRRPCCWLGCIHRKDKKISPSVQGVIGKQNKKHR